MHGLATGIIVAAAWWSWSAAAGAQERAAPEIRLRIGGYMEQAFGYARNAAGVRVAMARQTGLSSTVLARPNRWSQQSDGEIWFEGRARLANGLLVGFAVQLEANSQFNDQIDESYLFVQGAFGRLIAGSENDAAYLQHVSAPRPGAGWGILESALTGWVVTPRYVSFLTTTAPLSTGDDQKVTWLTPRLAGIQAGVSFTPNEIEDARGFSDHRGDRTNIASLSVNGRWRWDDVALDASLGWVHAPAAPGASSVDRRSPLDDWAAGAQLRWRGTAIGGGFRRLANPGGSQDGRVLAVGIAQDFGGPSLGASLLRSRTAGSPVSPGRDRGDTYLISGAWPIGGGVDVIGAVFTARFDAGRSRFGAEDRNQGAGAVGGLRLSF